jgi:hypothetical protein
MYKWVSPLMCVMVKIVYSLRLLSPKLILFDTETESLNVFAIHSDEFS